MYKEACARPYVPNVELFFVPNIENKTVACSYFYQKQSFHVIKDNSQVQKVEIYIDSTLDSDWKNCLKDGFNQIHECCPGLTLNYSFEKRPSRNPNSIEIKRSYEDVAKCMGDIFLANGAEIHLGNSWWNKKRSAVHEVLHAFGLDHEHMRPDQNKFFEFNLSPESEKGGQYRKLDENICVTRFDPFSIMMYCENEEMKRAGLDSVWKLKKDPNKLNQYLSELDKVALNIIFPPCVNRNYNPKIGKSGLYYCGRNVMKKHNAPAEDLTDGCCGPNNYPNCTACRVLKSDKTKKIVENNKWQGWSGGVYCGKWFGVVEKGHDGYCGPNNGPCCKECENYMF